MDIAIVNTSHIPDETIEKIIQAIEKVMPEFSKDWNVFGTLKLNGDSQIKCFISTLEVQNSRERAFHSLLNGIPYARVIVDKRDSLNLVSKMISHEIFELLANPMQDRFLKEYELEVCDPVDKNSFDVDGIQISDWILPAWFSYGELPYNHMNTLTRARRVALGGYINKRRDFH